MRVRSCLLGLVLLGLPLSAQERDTVLVRIEGVSFSIGVEPGPVVEGVEGGFVQFVATVTTQGGAVVDKPVRWIVGDSTVLLVDGDGMGLFLRAGSTWVSAEVTGVTPPSDTLPPVEPPGDTLAPLVSWLRSFEQYEPGHESFYASSAPIDANEGALFNYYDRGWAYYALGEYFADEGYREQGDDYVRDHLVEYMAPAEYKVPPRGMNVQSLPEYYARTGDDRAYEAAIVVADLAWFFAQGFIGGNDTEGRIVSRALNAQMVAMKFEPAEPQWFTQASAIVDFIAEWQEPSGRFSMSGTCGAQLNYMVGLMGWSLIRYHDEIDADPRIPVILERAGRYMLENEWWPTLEPTEADMTVFRYADGNCGNDGEFAPEHAPGTDLNGLILPLYSWPAQAADLRMLVPDLVHGMTTYAWLNGYNLAGTKQWTQHMRGFDGLHWN